MLLLLLLLMETRVCCFSAMKTEGPSSFFFFFYFNPLTEWLIIGRRGEKRKEIKRKTKMHFLFFFRLVEEEGKRGKITFFPLLCAVTNIASGRHSNHPSSIQYFESRDAPLHAQLQQPFSSSHCVPPPPPPFFSARRENNNNKRNDWSPSMNNQCVRRTEWAARRVAN